MLNEYEDIAPFSTLRWLRPSGVAGPYCRAAPAPGTLHAVSARPHRHPVRRFGAHDSAGRRFLPPRGIAGILRSISGLPGDSRARGKDSAGIGRSRKEIRQTFGISAKGVLPCVSFGMPDSAKSRACCVHDCPPRSNLGTANPLQLQAQAHRAAGSRTSSFSRNVKSRGNWPDPDVGPGAAFAGPAVRTAGIDGTVPEVGGNSVTSRKSFSGV